MTAHDTSGENSSRNGKDGSEQERLERMLARMDSNLDQIETQEILKGYSSEELRQKGLLDDDDNTIGVERSEYARRQQAGGLVLEAGIEFEIIETYHTPNQIPVEEIEYLPDVAQGRRVATQDTEITCERNCEVNYLQNAQLEAQGDVYIKNAAIQSEVYCTGHIYATEHKGALMGGTFHALRGIEAKSIGSPQGAKTRCVVGNDYLLQKKAKELNDIIEFNRKNIKKIDDILIPLIKALKKGASLSEDKKKKVRAVQMKRQQMRARIKMLKWKVGELKKREPAHLQCMIKVRDIIYPDVTLRIRDRTRQVKSEYKKAQYYYDKKSDSIQHASL